MTQWRCDWLPRLDIPNPGHVISAPGRHQPPVGTERDGGQSTLMTQGGAARTTRLRFPKLGRHWSDGEIIAPRQYRAPVGTEKDEGDRSARVQRSTGRLAGRN